MKFYAVCAAAAATLLAVTGASLAADSCPGQVATVRISKLIGTLDGFNKAVQDHQAWYKSHGDNTYVVVVPPAGPTPDKIISLTIHPDPATQMPKPDGDYKAFVKEYSENSEILLSGTACLTDEEARAKKQN